MPFADFPGDDRRSACYRGPEIIAAESRIITYAEALLEWMQRVDLEPGTQRKISDFMTHTTQRNPATKELEWPGQTTAWLLERTDPDANRFLMELIRAAWERRQWQERYGERVKGEL